VVAIVGPEVLSDRIARARALRATWADPGMTRAMGVNTCPAHAVAMAPGFAVIARAGVLLAARSDQPGHRHRGPFPDVRGAGGSRRDQHHRAGRGDDPGKSVPGRGKRSLIDKRTGCSLTATTRRIRARWSSLAVGPERVGL